MSVNSYSADCRVMFYPFRKPITMGLSPEEAVSSYRLEASEDIIDVATSKPKGGAGTFSITLGSRVNYKTKLQPGCWCAIYMSEDSLEGPLDHSPNGGLKMVGIIRSIRRIENVQGDGTRTVRYVVSGEDFHSGFTNPIYINANLTSIAGGANASITNGMLILGDRFKNTQTPDGMVEALIDALLGLPKYTVSSGIRGGVANGSAGRQGQPFRVPPELSKDIMGFRAEDNYFTGMVTLFLQRDLVGSVTLQSDVSSMVTAWSMIQAYSHGLLNEVYTDLLPVDTGSGVRLTPSIVFRAIPFSSTRIHKSNILLSDAGAIATASRDTNRAKFRQPLRRNPARHWRKLLREPPGLRKRDHGVQQRPKRPRALQLLLLPDELCGRTWLRR
jgi:hypothetical protein